jgi:hypothetical protein
MHPEIEKLIDMAIADGQITEKERNVILKKATELGFNSDEVEMILDGKLHQLEASKPKQKEKVGNIKTCPACGASTKSFQIKCEDCGHEFQNTKIDGYINEFKKTIDKVISEKHILYKYKVNNVEHEIPNETSKDKAVASLIKSYPLPKNKEDIIELLVYAHSNYESDESHKIWGIAIPKPVKDAWYAKAKQAIELLEVYGEKDPQSQNIINRYRQYFNNPNQANNKAKTKNSGCFKLGLIGFIIMLLIGGIYTVIPLSKEDKKIKSEINIFLEQNKLDSAISKINYIDNTLEKKKTINKILNKAIEINDLPSAKKVIIYYDSEYEQEEGRKKIFKLESK